MGTALLGLPCRIVEAEHPGHGHWCRLPTPPALSPSLTPGPAGVTAPVLRRVCFRPQKAGRTGCAWQVSNETRKEHGDRAGCLGGKCGRKGSSLFMAGSILSASSMMAPPSAPLPTVTEPVDSDIARGRIQGG